MTRGEVLVAYETAQARVEATRAADEIAQFKFEVESDFHAGWDAVNPGIYVSRDAELLGPTVAEALAVEESRVTSCDRRLAMDALSEVVREAKKEAIELPVFANAA